MASVTPAPGVAGQEREAEAVDDQGEEGRDAAPQPRAVRAADDRDEGRDEHVVGVVDASRARECARSRARSWLGGGIRRPSGVQPGDGGGALLRCGARLVDGEQGEAEQHDRAGHDRDRPQEPLEHAR
jgi:hypothetical protein